MGQKEPQKRQSRTTGGTACGVDPFTETEAGDKGETFARESGSNIYTITVTNHGEEATKGTVTVEDQLPKGILLGAEQEPLEFSAPGWKCKPLPAASTAECTTSETKAAGQSFNPIKLYVAVRPEAESLSINRPTVSGGGAAPVETAARQQESETTVTAAVPFGIKTFSTNVLESLRQRVQPGCGAPVLHHDRARSQPQPDRSAGWPGTELVGPAGNGAKEIHAEMPAGFSGDPQNIPQCPLRSSSTECGCPANTAVGYTNTLVAGGRDRKR